MRTYLPPPPLKFGSAVIVLLLQVVKGCYDGVRPKFDAKRSPAVLRGLDFLKIPQEMRPAGLVVQDQLREIYDSLLQQARQPLEAAETDIDSLMTPDDNGVATLKLYLCQQFGDDLSVEVCNDIIPGQPYIRQPPGTIEADPWFSSVLRRAAEGCGFKASVKRVSSDWHEQTHCTCLNLSLDLPETRIAFV